ncbi:MAG: helix-turn-helix domain-containing protein [Pseudonocardia sp.]|nr:helix-turn-helix domain-containing protein [Pseudonocardia sp.]
MPPAPPPTLRAAAREALDDRDRLGAVVLEAITSALPELTGEPHLVELLDTTVADVLTAGLSVFGSGVPIDSARAPGSGLELARHFAQRGIALATMLRVYRLGQAAFQQELITRVAELSSSTGEVADAARELSSATFGFVDLVTEEVVAAYQAEREGWLHRRNAARLAAVGGVLGAEHPAERIDQETERALGYPLGGVHLGAVLWCGPDGDETELERRVDEAATALGCARGPLVVAPDASTLWVWFPAPSEPATVMAPVVGTGTFAAVGDLARGVDGFRRTHRQARGGRTVAAAARPADRAPVTTPEALGPLALLALEPGGIGPWVDAVLGGLARDDEPTARLRETLWSYLAAGGSRAAAASALHLHRNTIQYRLNKAEQVRGRPIDGDRLDVEVALLACRVLGAVALRPGDG